MTDLRARLTRDPVVRELLRSLPIGVALLDSDFRIVTLNPAAEMVFGPGSEVVGTDTGDALHCINAVTSEQGCGGSPLCQACLLRSAATAALAGDVVSQREVRMQVRRAGAEEDRVLLLSAAPFRADGEPLAVVLLQDVTALHRLRGLVPICASCKKIRRDDQAWEQVEAYIESHSYAEFTHGLCPDCLQRFVADR